MLVRIWKCIQIYFTHLEGVGPFFSAYPAAIPVAAIMLFGLLCFKVVTLLAYEPPSGLLEKLRRRSPKRLWLERAELRVSFAFNLLGAVICACGNLILLLNWTWGVLAWIDHIPVHELYCACFLAGLTLDWRLLSGMMLRGVVVWWKKRMPQECPVAGWWIGCFFALCIFAVSFGIGLLAPVGDALVREYRWPCVFGIIRYVPLTFLLIVSAVFARHAVLGDLRKVIVEHYTSRGEHKAAAISGGLSRLRMFLMSLQLVLLFIASAAVLVGAALAGISWVWLWASMLMLLRIARRS